MLTLPTNDQQHIGLYILVFPAQKINHMHQQRTKERNLQRSAKSCGPHQQIPGGHIKKIKNTYLGHKITTETSP